MYDVKRSSTDSSQASTTRGATGPGKQTLTSQLTPAPPASAQASASTAAPAPSAGAAPPEVLARIGARFTHLEDTSARRDYQITAGGGFLLVASSDGSPPGKLEFRADNQFKAAWSTLCAYVVKHQAEIAPLAVTPAPAPAPAAPAPDPMSFEGITAAIGSGLAAVGTAVGAGLAAIGGGVQAITDAIASFFGSAPAAPAPDAGVAPAPDTGVAPAPGVTPAPVPEPASGDPKTVEAMPAMSQFRWYDTSFTPLGIDGVFAAAQLVATTFGFGGPVTKVTEPTADVKKKNPNQGYWWFKADGTPTWNGTTGTQYVTFTIHDGETSSKLNPASAYLAEKPPGQRPATMTFGGKTIDVPAEVQALNLRNIPGPRSCFATGEAMMAQAGVHAVGSDLGQGILPITSETYRDYTEAELRDHPDEADRKKSIAREVVGVTCDAAAAIKAKAYLDFELDHGRPVFTGVTYKEAPTLNNDQRTDHWVVISGRAGTGYTFNDPSDGSSGKQLVWDGEKLHLPGHDPDHPEYLYVVSWIRPNAESLKDWSAHWAQRQDGARPA